MSHLELSLVMSQVPNLTYLKRRSPNKEIQNG